MGPISADVDAESFVARTSTSVDEHGRKEKNSSAADRAAVLQQVQNEALELFKLSLGEVKECTARTQRAADSSSEDDREEVITL